ncbi:hypothetical protein ES705_41346 [subsurface metagenome]
MGKKSYEFIDLPLKKEIEEQLEDREEQERKKRFKICLRCGERKSPFYFAIDRRSTDDRTGECLACRSKRALAYYYNNREKILSKIKEYQSEKDRSSYFQGYREGHKEHLSQLAKKWYRKNRKRIKKRNLEYYEANKEACQAIRKKWIEGHKERIKEYNREYNLKMKGG